VDFFEEKRDFEGGHASGAAHQKVEFKLGFVLNFAFHLFRNGANCTTETITCSSSLKRLEVRGFFIGTKKMTGKFRVETSACREPERPETGRTGKVKRHLEDSKLD